MYRHNAFARRCQRGGRGGSGAVPAFGPSPSPPHLELCPGMRCVAARQLIGLFSRSTSYALSGIGTTSAVVSSGAPAIAPAMRRETRSADATNAASGRRM